jgi:hypothetical protein
VVAKGVSLTRERPAPAVTITIDGIHWSDAPALPEAIRAELGKRGTLCLVGHVKERVSLAEFERFAAGADLRFFFEADGHARLGTGAESKPLAQRDRRARWVVIPLGPADVQNLADEVEYRIRPRNHHKGFRWAIADGVTVVRH